MKIGNITDIPLDLSKCWLWQYDNAPFLNGIMNNLNQFAQDNIVKFYQDWFNNVFNLQTANTFGLEVWGRILGTPRPMINPQNFGLDKDGNIRLYNPTTQLWYLIWAANPQFRVSLDGILEVATLGITDEAYKRILLSRILLYYMRGTLPEIQRYFETLFPDSSVQVSSRNNMTYDVIFSRPLNNEDFSILTFDKVIPEVSGVKASSIVISQNFGFQNEGDGGNPTNSYPFTWIENDTTDYTGHGTFIN